MRGTKNRIAFAAAVALMALAAHASEAFTLKEDGCSGTCETSPLGEVTLTQAGVNTEVSDPLFSGDEFIGAGAIDTLGLDITDPTITITGLIQDLPASTLPPGPLDFRATDDFVAALTPSNDGIYFTSDILGSNGIAGNAAPSPFPGNLGSAVPAPLWLLLVGSGLIGLGLLPRWISA